MCFLIVLAHSIEYTLGVGRVVYWYRVVYVKKTPPPRREGVALLRLYF